MRRVMHLLGTGRAGFTAIARIVHLSSQALAPDLYETHACFLDGDGDLRTWLEDRDIPSFAVHWGGARNLSGDLRVWRHLRRYRPDIVHAHFGGEYLRGLARLAGVRRIIAHFHDHGHESGGGRVFSTRFSDLVIATSSSVAAKIQGRSLVIRPGLPEIANACRHQGREPPVLGALARLVPVKGHLTLLRAMPIVRAEFPRLRLEIAGEGPERGRLTAEIDRLGLKGAVTLLGWQEDIGGWLARWNLLVHPSLDEGFGLSLLDAAQVGLPIVASAVGGIPELITPQRDGLLVPPGDPTALAAAIIEAMRDPDRMERFAASLAVKVRQEFGFARFAGQMRAAYAGL